MLFENDLLTTTKIRFQRVDNHNKLTYSSFLKDAISQQFPPDQLRRHSLKRYPKPASSAKRNET